MTSLLTRPIQQVRVRPAGVDAYEQYPLIRRPPTAAPASPTSSWLSNWSTCLCLSIIVSLLVVAVVFIILRLQSNTTIITDAPPTTLPPITTQPPTTQAPTTLTPTTLTPTTQAPTTTSPTTQAPTTQLPTTLAPTTQVPTTQAPTTQIPTTASPTTVSPTTQVPTTSAPLSPPQPTWRIYFTITSNVINDGTSQANTTFTTGASATTMTDSNINDAYVFNRVDINGFAIGGYYTVDYIATTGGFSKSIWVQLSRFSSTTNNLLSSSGNGDALFTPNRNGIFGERGGTNSGAAAVSDTSPIPLNTWTYLAVTYDNSFGLYSFYTNGMLKSTAFSYPPSVGNTFQLGAFESASGLDGKIYLPAYWAFTLSATNIKDDYNARCVNITGCILAV